MTTSQNELVNGIRRIVTDEWEKRERPVFLSQLGLRLSPQAKAELRGTGLSLKEYIQRYLSEDVRLLIIGQTGDLLAPGNETQNMTDDQLAALVRAAPTIPRERTFRRFYRALWEAFWLPLPEGTRRYVEITGNDIKRYDVPAEESSPPGSKEISRGDLPQRDPVKNWVFAGDVADSIREWANKNNLLESDLYDPDSKTVRESRAQALTEGSGVDRLRSLLEILNQEELAKLNIPSDVLLSILKKN